MPINKYSHTQRYSHVRYAKKKNLAGTKLNNAKYTRPASKKKKKKPCVHAPMRYPNKHRDD